MFENYEVKKCAWCNKYIKNQPLKTLPFKYEFCDIACAKLYDLNIEKIQLNLKEYNNLYVNNLLTTKSKNIYEITNTCLFETLPFYKIQKNESRTSAKKKYENIIQS